jgi:hypothetical protein
MKISNKKACGRWPPGFSLSTLCKQFIENKLFRRQRIDMRLKQMFELDRNTAPWNSSK